VVPTFLAAWPTFCSSARKAAISAFSVSRSRVTSSSVSGTAAARDERGCCTVSAMSLSYQVDFDSGD